MAIFVNPTPSGVLTDGGLTLIHGPGTGEFANCLADTAVVGKQYVEFEVTILVDTRVGAGWFADTRPLVETGSIGRMLWEEIGGSVMRHRWAASLTANYGLPSDTAIGVWDSPDGALPSTSTIRVMVDADGRTAQAAVNGESFSVAVPIPGTNPIFMCASVAVGEGNSTHMRPASDNVYPTPVGYTNYMAAASSGPSALDAEPGSIVLAGQIANLLRTRILGAQGKSLTLTRTPATLKYSRILGAQSRALTLSGAQAFFPVARRIQAESAAFALTGANADVRTGSALSAESGSFALSGSETGFRLNRVITADGANFGATFLEADVAIQFAMAYELLGEHGLFGASGASIEFVLGKSLIAESGVFDLESLDADLTVHQAGSFGLSADAGEFSAQVSSADLRINRILASESAILLWTGSDVDVLKTRSLVAESGVFQSTGLDATVLLAWNLNLESGTFGLSGKAATLVYSEAEIPVPTTTFQVPGRYTGFEAPSKITITL